MLDNFRKQTDESEFFKEEEPALEISRLNPAPAPRRARTFDQITGTTAFQRFVLSVMFLVMVCLLGVMLLVLTGKVIVPAFLY